MLDNDLRRGECQPTRNKLMFFAGLPRTRLWTVDHVEPNFVLDCRPVVFLGSWITAGARLVP